MIEGASMDAVEIDLKRLLHRMQGMLADASHASVSIEEALKRWTYVEHAQGLIGQLSQNYTSDDDVKRLATYENKLTFISQLMQASEGNRPLLGTSATSTISQSSLHDTDAKMKKQAISAEQQWTRATLLSKTNRSRKDPSSLGSDAELRRRLGLSREGTKGSGNELDLSTQLEQDQKMRDALANDVLGLIDTLKENSLNVQKSLQSDTSRIEIVDQLVNKNLDNVKKEITRVDTLFKSTSASCRANCALVSTVLTIWIVVYIVMKITPRPA